MSSNPLINELSFLDELNLTADRSFYRLSNKYGLPLVEQCISAGYVLRRPDYSLRITQSGAQRLADLRAQLYLIEQDAKQLSEQNSKEKRKITSDRIFQLLLTLLSFALGMLAEHLSGILESILSVPH